MLKMSPTSTTQNLMHLVDKFGEGDCGKNEARKASTSMKGPIRVDDPSSDHVSYAVSNIVSNSAKNVSKYLTPNAKKSFDQLRQAFTQVPMFQHFDPEQYIRVVTDMSEHAIGGMLS